MKLLLACLLFLSIQHIRGDEPPKIEMNIFQTIANLTTQQRTMIKFVRARAKKAEKELCEFIKNYQDRTKETIEKIFTKVNLSSVNVGRIWSANCEEYQKSVNYCGFIEELKNSTENGVRKLEEFIEKRFEITDKAQADYLKELSEHYVEKLMEYDFDPERIMCYLNPPKNESQTTAAPFKMTGNDNGAQKYGALHTEALEEFIERMNDYRARVIENFKLVQNNYETCVATNGTKKCLERFTKAQEKLPFKFDNMMDEIEELIMDHLSLVGPDIEEAKAKMDEHDPDIENAIVKCNLLPVPTMPPTLTTAKPATQ